MQGNQPSGSFVINAQYIKDFSFENPKAPHAILQDLDFNLSVGVDIGAAEVDENLFEVTLALQVHASVESETVFIVDLKYGGLFTVEDAEKRDYILFVQCPTLLFPYARQIVSNVTGDGGYSPLNLAPVDFYSIYLQKQESQQNSNESPTITN